ncbi:MAG: UDP-N-acetylglucosamine 2-epimerase (non-hydrolyzing) [Rhodospirillaceae bacterium]|nr:UDP-N-acetylglucosamine 2-epimerase (non-hydrolyzing) [Rhodospirillaceae bacterium]
MVQRILTVLGTRPEAIKLAPLIRLLDQNHDVEHAVCSTGQHREMMQPIFGLFGVAPTFNLNLMRPGISLSELQGSMMTALQGPLRTFRPDIILVQGDTTTAFGAALAAYYNKVKIGHVEAGLRTGDLNAPWPEEGNRKLIGAIADWHFAPTRRTADNLIREGVARDTIHITGNTGIDALEFMRKSLRTNSLLLKSCAAAFPFIDPNKKLILMTGHRRENFGDGLNSVFRALRTIAERDDVQIVYPVHMNPNVQGPAQQELAGIKNVFLVPPATYPQMIYLMEHAKLIITDSGGIQEEAPSFGKPVLVTRDVTERQEAIEAGAARLVGTNADVIIAETLAVLNQAQERKAAPIRNPFGDGYASERIINTLLTKEGGFMYGGLVKKKDVG